MPNITAKAMEDFLGQMLTVVRSEAAELEADAPTHELHVQRSSATRRPVAFYNLTK